MTANTRSPTIGGMASVTHLRNPSLGRFPGRRPTPAGPRARVLARRRAVALLLLLFLCVTAGWMAGASSRRGGDGGSRLVAPRFYEVRAGDTLWDVARRLHRSGDLRATVDRLAASRGTGPLRPGERILF